MGLIAWYPLNGDTKDYSGNGNDLTYNNNNGKLVLSPSGKIGECYEREAAQDGSDYFRGEKQIDLTDKSFTITCWALVTDVDLGTANGLITNHSHSDNSGGGITVKTISSSDYRISCNTGTGSSRTFHTYYGSSNIKDKWSHLILRFNKKNNNLTLWVNGEQEYEGTYEMFCKEDNIDIFNWSTSYSSSSRYRPACKINDVRIYDHALSTKEIKELAKAKVLHYKFDDFQEPTENLLPENTKTHASGGMGSYWSGQIDTGNTEKELLSFKVTTVDNDRLDGFISAAGTDLIEGEDYTYSLDVWVPLGKTIQTRIRNTTGGGWTSGSNINTSGTDSWIRVYKTFTATSNSACRIEGTETDDVTDVYSFWIRNLQIEKKSHSTPFTVIPREGTVLDCSGYKNNAELVLTTTPKWTEDSRIGSGAYVFNGSNTVNTNKIFYDNTNQAWTCCAWVYVNDSYVSGQYLNNFNLGNKIVHAGANGKGLLYANSGANDHYTYSSTRMLENQWFHMAFVYSTDPQICRIYINGQLDLQNSSWDPARVPSGFSSTTIFGQGLAGKLDDVRIYATALSANDIKEIYETRASLDEIGNFELEKINENIIIETFNTVGGTVWTVPEGIRSVDVLVVAGGGGGASGGGGGGGVIYKNNVSVTPEEEISITVGAGGVGGNGSTSNPSGSNGGNSVFGDFIALGGGGGGRAVANGLSGGSGGGAGAYDQATTVGGSGTTGQGNSGGNTVHGASPYGSGGGGGASKKGEDTKGTGWSGNGGDGFAFYATHYGGGGGGGVYSGGARAGAGGKGGGAEGRTVSGAGFSGAPNSGGGGGGVINGSVGGAGGSGTVMIIYKTADNVGLNNKGEMSNINISQVGPTDGLVGWWPLDGHIKDVSGNYNHAENNGATITQGIKNLAYNFNGTSQYLNIPNNETLDLTTQGTVSLWARTDREYPSDTASTAYRGILARSISGSAGGVSYYIDWTGNNSSVRNLRMRIGDDSGSVGPIVSFNFESVWQHIVGTWDGSKVILYTNGIKIGEADQTLNAKLLNTGLNIGRAFGSTAYCFEGDIGDVRLYNKALSAEEIKILYDMTYPDGAKMKISEDTLYIKGQIKEVD